MKLFIIATSLSIAALAFADNWGSFQSDFCRGETFSTGVGPLPLMTRLTLSQLSIIVNVHQQLLMANISVVQLDVSMSDLAPTQNQADNPQLILMGTPPKPSDPSETFTNLRDSALEDRSEGLAYIEFSAEPGSDPDDRAAWRAANPSIGTRTPERAIVRLRKLLANDDDFMREALGIWDSSLQTNGISLTHWAALAASDEQQMPGACYGLATAPDRSWSCLAAAWRRSDGVPQLSIVRYEPGTAWVDGASPSEHLNF